VEGFHPEEPAAIAELALDGYIFEESQGVFQNAQGSRKVTEDPMAILPLGGKLG
jgi:hypothetical protein